MINGHIISIYSLGVINYFSRKIIPYTYTALALRRAVKNENDWRRPLIIAPGILPPLSDDLST